MKTYGFIFARGGSKGLSKKNIKDLLGKPLIQYSIEVGRQVEDIQEIFLSTDCKEIAEVGRSLGCVIIERPSELAGDNSSEWHAWQHAVEYVKEHYGDFKCFVSLPATSPLKSAEDVSACIQKWNSGNIDLCVTITASHSSPFFNMVKIDPTGFVSLVNGSEEVNVCRQHAPKVYDVTTVCYVTSPDNIKARSSVLDGNIGYVEVPKERAVDIDDIHDFNFAKSLLENKLTK